MKPLSMEPAELDKPLNVRVRMSPTINILTPLLDTTVHLLKPKDIVPIFFTAGLGWMKQMSEEKKPFFAYISTNAPHGPFIAPPKNAKRFTDLGFSERDAGFYGMIENIDENMGILMKKLDQWDLNQDTILIFMSDNGSVGGMVRQGSKLGMNKDGKVMEGFNAGMKGAKGSADEGGVRVPFFVRWQGKFGAGREIEKLSAHIDLLPTLAEIAGIKQITEESNRWAKPRSST